MIFSLVSGESRSWYALMQASEQNRIRQ